MSNTFDKLSVLDSFIEEVNSYLPDIETNLDHLAQSPDDMDALEETYRRTHTIGGSASMMDFPGLAHVAHGMEDVLGDALEELITIDEPALGLLRRSLDRLHRLLEGIRNGIDEEAVIAEDDADYAHYRSVIKSSGSVVTPEEVSTTTGSYPNTGLQGGGKPRPTFGGSPAFRAEANPTPTLGRSPAFRVGASPDFRVGTSPAPTAGEAQFLQSCFYARGSNSLRLSLI